MAGHSKWANIKHRKGAQDAKRAKVFTPIIRDIMVACRSGGGDPNMNASLRTVLANAKSVNMPKDVIERAIKRGTGEIKGEDYVERTYEGYASGGVAVIVKALTDNGTRTVTNVRTAFNKNGGNMGNDGAVAWMFKEEGFLYYPKDIGEEDDVMEKAIEAGADDFVAEEEGYRISTSVEDFGTVRDALAEIYGKAEEGDLTYTPTQTQEVTDLETAQKVMKVVAALEDDDDVQEAISNMDISDELAEQL
ncbi:MAG: YebC/PmpR family DNA-binding transcriptional regulator [Alphaproteobacteria bacterium]|nr:YebC/PmpR family DNA-binding transcriptional regulator [Alphaproteobacteria bacterium]MDD9920530.1 YebC/PmpR family DNA-binding transcriptional regulator [Alphaproteobacteria bacterium]